MIAFLDTEFTDFVDPQLLSVGLVVGAGSKSEFYGEVTDSDRIRAASRFASNVVLTQFGKVEGAACPYAEIGVRVSTFFAHLVTSLEPRETIEVAYESDIDWKLLKRAIEDAGGLSWELLVTALRPVNVYNVAGFQAGQLAADAYFDAQRLAPFSRHQALCDARALRIGYLAAAAWTAERVSTDTPFVASMAPVRTAVLA
jgi:hypothetical protein